MLLPMRRDGSNLDEHFDRKGAVSGPLSVLSSLVALAQLPDGCNLASLQMVRSQATFVGDRTAVEHQLFLGMSESLVIRIDAVVMQKGNIGHNGNGLQLLHLSLAQMARYDCYYVPRIGPR